MGSDIMTILNKDVWQNGHFIEFAYLEKPLSVTEYECLDRTLYSHGLFFEMELGLLEDYCFLTEQYSPFDPYANLDISKHEELIALAGKFIEWSSIVLRRKQSVFAELQSYCFYESSLEGIPVENLRCDLVETLLFISGKVVEAARNRHTITIVGI
jgi:hypothetical protein